MPNLKEIVHDVKSFLINYISGNDETKGVNVQNIIYGFSQDFRNILFRVNYTIPSSGTDYDQNSVIIMLEILDNLTLNVVFGKFNNCFWSVENIYMSPDKTTIVMVDVVNHTKIIKLFNVDFLNSDQFDPEKIMPPSDCVADNTADDITDDILSSEPKLFSSGAAWDTQSLVVSEKADHFHIENNIISFLEPNSEGRNDKFFYYGKHEKNIVRILSEWKRQTIRVRNNMISRFNNGIDIYDVNTGQITSIHHKCRFQDQQLQVDQLQDQQILEKITTIFFENNEKIVINEYLTERSVLISIYDIKTKNLEITFNLQADVYLRPNDATVSPDGNFMVFYAMSDNEAHMYLINLKTSTVNHFVHEISFRIDFSFYGRPVMFLKNCSKFMLKLSASEIIMYDVNTFEKTVDSSYYRYDDAFFINDNILGSYSLRGAGDYLLKLIEFV